ncbi:hypothetical protein C1646_666094 [Rhizophagus diaphanus]|nr:hypothetical protein C1646_666094 [Rhizophagus diaphanus] [Rhizophagus sp. MUCL 43196]
MWVKVLNFKVSDIVSDFSQGFRFRKAVFEYHNCLKPETEIRPKLGVSATSILNLGQIVLRPNIPFLTSVYALLWSYRKNDNYVNVNNKLNKIITDFEKLFFTTEVKEFIDKLQEEQKECKFNSAFQINVTSSCTLKALKLRKRKLIPNFFFLKNENIFKFKNYQTKGRKLYICKNISR